MKSQKFIIEIKNYGRLGAGYLSFEWVSGRKHPESFWCSGKIAKTLTERQKDYFTNVLDNNGEIYNVIELS